MDCWIDPPEPTVDIDATIATVAERGARSGDSDAVVRECFTDELGRKPTPGEWSECVDALTAWRLCVEDERDREEWNRKMYGDAAE